MAKGQKRHARPPAVSIIVLIFVIQVAAFAVVEWLHWTDSGAVTLGELPGAFAAAWLQGERWVDLLLSLGVLFLAVASAFTAIGLARMRPWAWLWAMTIQGVRLLIGLIAYFRGDPYSFAMVLQLIAVLLLDQAPVRRAFGQEGRQGG
jgi:hypothetical protein